MRTIYNVLGITFILFLTSCEKEMMSYKGLEGVYFAVQYGDSWSSDAGWPFMPYSTVEYFNIEDDEHTVTLRLRITGELKDYDRFVKIEIDQDSTDAVLGVDYDIIQDEVTIPANEINGYYSIKTYRTPELRRMEKNIHLKLIPNEYFDLSFTQWDAITGLNSGLVIEKFDNSRHKIVLNDLMVQPNVWPGSVDATGCETGSWGAFSIKKIELLFEIFDLEYEDFSDNDKMPYVMISYISSYMSEYLEDLYDKKQPILEDDGRLMWFGGITRWRSYIGVPWVPEF